VFLKYSTNSFAHMNQMIQQEFYQLRDHSLIKDQGGAGEKLGGVAKTIYG
jgi:hypothetical protein